MATAGAARLSLGLWHCHCHNGAMTTLAIWLVAGALYAGFWAWYVGFGRRLTPADVDRSMEKLSNELKADPERRKRMRQFLEADDGREFFMVNLIKLEPGLVTPPGGGTPAPAQKVLEGYTGPFMGALFRRAGHPALIGRAAAGYLEEWNVDPNPGWTVAGVVRYRSRRDLVEMASMPQFHDIHLFKRAAMASTYAFPIAPARLFFSPRLVAGLVVALAAALLTAAVG